MWRDTRMVVLCAISGALHAAVLVPFKDVPQTGEVRAAPTGLRCTSALAAETAKRPTMGGNPFEPCEHLEAALRAICCEP